MEFGFNNFLYIFYHFLLLFLFPCVGKSISKTNVIYAAFFVQPTETRLFSILPVFHTVQSILLSENGTCIIYSFPDDLGQMLKYGFKKTNKQKLEDYSQLRHEDSLIYEPSKLKSEMMLIRIDMYRQFLQRHCCDAHIVFTDLDQLFLSSMSEYFFSASLIRWDMAHIHKRHGNNAGLFLIQRHGIKYGQNIFSKVLNIYNTTVRHKICKGGMSCLQVGGEQLAIDELLGGVKDSNWLVNIGEWYLPFEGGVILNLDSKIFNAVPGRFEVTPNSKVMHFMGYRKKCMNQYFNSYKDSGIQAILRMEGYKPSVMIRERRRICKRDNQCKTCKVLSKSDCDASLLKEYNMMYEVN